MAESIREWIWADLPDEINVRLGQWRDMFCKTVRNADPVAHLHITVFHEVLHFEDNLVNIIAQVANTPPAFAQLGRITAFRTDNGKGLAIVVQVISPELEAMRRRLEKVIDYRQSVFTYYPHVTLAYVPATDVSLDDVNKLHLHGIVGKAFVIDEVKAGTIHSNHACALLGHNGPIVLAEPESSVFAKDARGLSALSGEAGGFLSQKAEALPEDEPEETEDEPEESDFEDDDEDDYWMNTSMSLADSLDEQFGDF
mgnify:CR=1 FL=1